MINEEYDTYQSKKINKKLLLIILAMLIIIVGIITFIYFIKGSKQRELDNSLNIFNQLLSDFENGQISADEYVRYNLYAEYDSSLLKKEYSNLQKSEVAIHVEELVNKYYEQLSRKTKKYYIEKINLDNLSFELDKENKSTKKDISLSNVLIDTVQAKSYKATNLNKAVLSKNGNFVVWYTTTGDSATDYNSAKKVADGLENTVKQYNELSSYKFNFKSNVLSKGKVYNNQIKILENENIDTKYLESAMQVYLVEYGDSSLAQYIDGYGKMTEIFNSIKSKDKNGSVVFPYILIKPSSFDDYEKLSQLYNHELFHYYQHHVLCGKANCSLGKDEYIGEATANWASSIATNKTTNEGFLNNWAGDARYNSNALMGTYKENNGPLAVGYSLFVYLNNYSSIVNNGKSKIVKSIYKDNALEYLEDNATEKELVEIQETIALKNLTQDYINKNLVVSNSYGYDIYLKDTITDSYSVNDVNINELGISYYLLNKDSTSAFKINFKKDNKHVSALIIKKQNNKYEIVDSADTNNEYIFNTNKYGDYDLLYIVIYNKKLTLKNYYSLTVDSTTKEEIKEDNEQNEIPNIDTNNPTTEVIAGDMSFYVNGKKFLLPCSFMDFVSASGASYDSAKLEEMKKTSKYGRFQFQVYFGEVEMELLISYKDNETKILNMSIGADSDDLDSMPDFVFPGNIRLGRTYNSGMEAEGYFKSGGNQIYNGNTEFWDIKYNDNNYGYKVYYDKDDKEVYFVEIDSFQY